MRFKREITAFLFGVILTVSILMCCFAFKTADNNRQNQTAVGSEVFTVALPIMLVIVALKEKERAIQKQKKKTTQLKVEMQQQEKVIQNLARELHYLKLPHIVRAKNVAEKPTE